MAIFTVHNRIGAPPEKAVLVGDGFSFGAFVFTVLWALWHRMWLVAAGLLAVSGAIAVAGSTHLIPEFLAGLLNFAVSLMFGFEARDLQRRSLVAAGRPEMGLTHGRKLEDAELNYFLALGPGVLAAPAPVEPVQVPGNHLSDPLGIFGKL